MRVSIGNKGSVQSTTHDMKSGVVMVAIVLIVDFIFMFLGLDLVFYIEGYFTFYKSHYLGWFVLYPWCRVNRDTNLFVVCVLCNIVVASRDVRWSKFVGTGKERNVFPFKKDLSLSHFFRFFSFLERVFPLFPIFLRISHPRSSPFFSSFFIFPPF